MEVKALATKVGCLEKEIMNMKNERDRLSVSITKLETCVSAIQSRDERNIVAQLWKTTIWGYFFPKIVLWLWLWCSLSENCGRGCGCG